MTPADSAAELRRRVYTLLIAVAAAAAAGRILAVQRMVDPGMFRGENETDPDRGPWPGRRPEPWPMLNPNDRSRWATVRALVDEGTYVVGRRRHVKAPPGKPDYVDEGIITKDGWETNDKVLKPDTQDFYSSKPPLLPTLAAGEYWLLKKAFGWSIVDQRWEVVRTILLTFNGLGLLAYLWAVSRLAELFGATDWGRLFAVTAACFGTLVTPFLTTFNNHTIATFAAGVALYAAARAARAAAGRWGWFALAGFAAGFTAANELPAAALLAGLFVFLLRRAPARTLAAFLPAAAVPVAALLLTNYLALGQWRPAYGEFGGPWYQYEGSHWQVKPDEPKRGIDWARYNGEPVAVYAFHLLLGHHGAFSLFPVFLVAAAGMLWGTARFARGVADGDRPPPDGEDRTSETSRPPAPPAPWAELAALALAVSVVVIGFYVAVTGNYGGWTSGPRWLMWLTPLWLVAMVPAADRLGRRRGGRALALALLALSVLSAAYPAWSPWRHPWIYNWMQHNGWIHY
jgi:hypothetical protein